MYEENSKFLTTVENVIGLMKEELGNMSPLRLQKTLYFLFAYYGATYGSMSESKESRLCESNKMNLPKYLFDGQFEAWQYGPVLKDVYVDNKYKNLVDNSQFTLDNFFFNDETMKIEVKNYLKELIALTSNVSDFGLVERSHEDIEWKKNKDNQSVMSNENIIEEYKKLVHG